MTAKKTGGRQKIEMKKIEKKSSRQVTFTKRRGGLFKKAAELCVLTGAEVAVIVQSPGNHVYAFGHRDVDSIIETFLGNNVSLSENPRPMHEEEYNKYLEVVNHELEVEKSKSNNVVQGSRGFWWEDSFEDMEMDELEVFIKSMEELKNNMRNKADELRNSVTNFSLINTNGGDDQSRNLVASSSLINTNGADDESRNLVASSLLINTNGADESRNLVASSLLINTNGADESRNLVASFSLNNTNGADESRNLFASSSLINTNGADESRNLVASFSFDTNTNLSNVDGLLDDQEILSNLDQFLLNNDAFTDEELMMMQAFNNNYSFGNGELAFENHDLLNHGGNNYQVSSDFGVPNDNNFGDKGQ